MRESLDHCVKCTICETFCPVSNVTPLFPGPKYAGPQAERFRVGGGAVGRRVAGLLLGLRDLHAGLPAGRAHRRDQLAGARGAEGDGAASRCATASSRARRWPAGSARRSRRWRTGRCATGCCGWSASGRSGLHRDAPMPRFAGRTFQRWARQPAGLRPAAARRVAYFHGCGTNYYEPRLGEMTVALLEHNGCAVDVPKQDCCGLPLQSNGLFDDARGYVHRLAARLAPFARAGVDIVGTSTSVHADAQARGAGDPRDGRRRGPAGGLRARVRHLRVPADAARSRRAADGLRAAARDGRLPRPVPAAGARDRQAGAGPDGARARS